MIDSNWYVSTNLNQDTEDLHVPVPVIHEHTLTIWAGLLMLHMLLTY